MYKKIVDEDFTWENFSIEEQSKILASDRSNNLLDTNRLTILYPNVLNINDARYYISNQKLKDLGWTIGINLMDGLGKII